MTALCAEFHQLARRGALQSFPFDRTQLPLNGIYLLFEAGEECHDGNRIVRVGTHTGDGQLPSRLLQHFVNENKDRSIFRKNIGRALLSKTKDPFLTEWERDRTSRAARLRFGAVPDPAKLRAVEADVTRYVQERFSFTIFRVEDRATRLMLESKMISTVSLCDECKPSVGWLGLNSPKQRIRERGLWLVNELFKEPLSPADLEHLPALLVT